MNSNANLEFIDALNNLTPTLKSSSTTAANNNNKLSKHSKSVVHHSENINILNANNLNGKFCFVFEVDEFMYTQNSNQPWTLLGI